ncbi:MAG TPA: MarR family transcriptional regulator [Candidatus Acidoferrum sp.]|nr:MarR family transcriptional regulator [Candidatus Acidoferrum sp.]
MQAVGDKRFEGLSTRQFMTMLAILHLRAHEATLNNIARKLGTSKQNCRQLVDALVKKGFVEINPNRADRRAYSVTATPSGLARTQKCSEIGMLLFADIFAGLGGSELPVLWELLSRIYSFDGEVYQGFEADPNDALSLDDAARESGQRALAAFIEKRQRAYIIQE